MIILNLFGAPNSGKTSTAAGLFAALKRAGVECDYVPELVRMAHYVENKTLLADELYLLAEKNHRMKALEGAGIEVAITDGPVLNSLVYRPKEYYPTFDQLVREVHDGYDNLNIYLPGVRNFSSIGRGEKNEHAAMRRGDQVFGMLQEFGYIELDPGQDMVEQATAHSIDFIDSMKKRNRKQLAI